MGERVAFGEPGPRPGTELELPGAAPHRQTVGEPVQEHRADPIRIDGVEVEPHPEPAGEIGGTLSQPIDGASIRPIVMTPPRDESHAQGEVAGHLVGTAAQHVALVDEHRNQASECGRFGHQHARQADVDRKPEHPAPDVGEPTVVVERAEVREQLSAGAHGLRRWCGHERQLVLVGAPCGELERQAGEVGLFDLRCAVRRSGAVLDLAPQPIAHPWLDTAGAPGALFGRRSAGARRW